MKRILPGSVIGILGGGQLGRMMALQARAMGYRITVLDPNLDSPCGQTADIEFVGSLDDIDTARRMANVSDVLTYEFENVSDELVKVLEQEYCLPQGGNTLHLTRHRVREKMALEATGIPVAPWRPVHSINELQHAVFELGFPCVLKTATGGYDGKGQFVIRQDGDIQTAWQELALTRTEPTLVLEQWVVFDRELSVIAARNPAGETAIFPTAENIHRQNILHMSIVPARIAAETDRRAAELARQIADALDVVGLLAVEMFERNGELMVNELAPRPHNSGHYSMDACATSQFEQHIRAICNLPLGSTSLLTPVVMVNILGEHVDSVLANAAHLGEGCKIHLYGKADIIDKRKMGHLNVLAPTVDEALATITELAIWKE